MSKIQSKAIVLFMMLISMGYSQQIAVQTTDGSWSGGTTLENHVMRVTLTPGYADVEEEASIRATGNGGWWWNPPTATEALELVGTMQFPQGSAAVGLFLWNGNQILKAKLKPTNVATEAYETVVNRDTAAPPLPRDPALLIRQDDRQYKMSIYPVLLNASRKVRLRYLVPMQAGSDSAMFDLSPVLRGSDYNTSETMSLIINGVYTKALLSKDGVHTTYTLPLQISTSVVNSMQLNIGSMLGAGSLRTSMDSGEWKGHYWLMNSVIPDSIIQKSNLRREVVVLWKWNFPEYFTTLQNGYTELTQDGYEAVDKAYYLGQIIQNTASSSPNIYWGMVHQIGNANPYVYALGNRTSKSYKDILAHLSSINYSTITQMVPVPPKNKTPSDKEKIQVKKVYQQSFDSLIAKSVALYSPSEKCIKHLVILTSGPKFLPETPTVKDIEEVAGLEGISVTLQEASNWTVGMELSWPGVNLGAIAEKHAPSVAMDSSNWFFYIPKDRPVHFAASIGVNGVSRYYDLPSVDNHLSLAFHTATPIDSSIDWFAFDENGNSLATYSQVVPSINMPHDSGVVKLVAAQTNAISDVYSSDILGAAFGVVRTNYALVAVEADSIGTENSISYKNLGLPYLTSNEIFMPTIADQNQETDVLQTANNSLKGLTVQSFWGGHVHIEASDALRQRIIRLEILDMKGRILATLDAQSLRTKGMLEWNAASFAKGGYCLRAQTKQGISSQIFWLY